MHRPLPGPPGTWPSRGVPRGGKRRLPSWYSSWLFLEENHGTCLQEPPAGLESSVLLGSVLRVVTFPLLPVNVVPSRKHKSQIVAGWRTTATAPDQCLVETRFLTFRLLPTPRAGAPRLVISFQTRTQLLQAAPVPARLTSSPCGQFRIDRTNTNCFGCMLFRVILKCFVSPGGACRTWATPAKADSDPEPREARAPSPVGS